MLHTQEKILRYELAQKRKLLTQLKEELEYSREKWAQAREKNTNTEQQWKQLRTEFASRKSTLNDDSNDSNSAESGYSDDKECSSSDEEPSYDTDEVYNGPRNSDSKKNNLSASTNTLTDSTENEEEIQTVKDNSIVINNSTADIPEETVPSYVVLSTNFPSQVLENVVVPEELNRSSNSRCVTNSPINGAIESESSNSQKDSHMKMASNSTEKMVEQTWERVSDIVQQEIQRLTDQVQKTDSNQDMFLLQERLSSGISRQVVKTDPQNTPGTSRDSGRTLEEVLAARNERFERLEKQAQQLCKKVANTNKRSDEISNKLDSLHETYGQSVDSCLEDTRTEEEPVETEKTNEHSPNDF